MFGSKNTRPKKSPHHHLIPEVKAKRRARRWYAMILVGVLYAVFVVYMMSKRKAGEAAQSSLSTNAETEVIAPLKNLGE